MNKLYKLSSEDFQQWCHQQEISLESGNPSFKDDYMFRIPIGDYLLQLDYRIKKTLLLFTEWPIVLYWPKGNATVHPNLPLHTILKQLTAADHGEILILTEQDQDILFAMIYLTNRWGGTGDTFYLLPHLSANKMLIVPYSTESLFIITRTEQLHDECVEQLNKVNVPTYGRHVKNPMPLPTYPDLDIGTSIIIVDPKTGKPIGPGSEESVLYEEFLPPE